MPPQLSASQIRQPRCSLLPVLARNSTIRMTRLRKRSCSIARSANACMLNVLTILLSSSRFSNGIDTVRSCSRPCPSRRGSICATCQGMSRRRRLVRQPFVTEGWAKNARHSGSRSTIPTESRPTSLALSARASARSMLRKRTVSRTLMGMHCPLRGAYPIVNHQGKLQAHRELIFLQGLTVSNPRTGGEGLLGQFN